MTEPFALYVHVPWCRRICPYCDFNVHAAATPPEDEYVAALVAEMEAHARDERWSARGAKSVYVGGGTPSLFSPGGIGRTLAAVGRVFGIVDGARSRSRRTPARSIGTCSPGIGRRA
jgi:oxygen-independent coproporphyrinogen-3 oxidase